MNINIPDQSEIIQHYGVENQFGIHMEECAELIQAISKCNREYKYYCSTDYMVDERDHLVEEIADVMICIEQLLEIFDIPEGYIEAVIRDKMDRQVRRMEIEDE